MAVLLSFLGDRAEALDAGHHGHRLFHWQASMTLFNPLCSTAW